MAAAAATAAPLETAVPTTRGFFVTKEATALYRPPGARGDASREDSAASASSSVTIAAQQQHRSVLSGLTSTTPAAVTPQPFSAAGAAPMRVSLQVAEHAHLSNGCKRLIRSVVRGLKACQDPEAATEGLGGTYFFCNEAGAKIAIMKPCDEEPMAPNNPKGFVGRRLGEPGLKPTVRVGEAASREVAAYLLDRGHFARVPHTALVKMAHPIFHVAPGQTAAAAGAVVGGEGLLGDGGSLEPPTPPAKLGSLQEFVPHDCDTSEMGASRFAVRDVHRIGILDVRLLNTDRHGGNILVRRRKAPQPVPSATTLGAGAGGEGGGAAHMPTSAMLGLESPYELIPIDHGFALPEALEPPYFEWQHWPQAMMPFDREELDYIASLDAAADVEMLRREVPSLREESLRLLEVSTLLLQRCAAAGLTLAEIATVATRPLIGMDEEPSELERICFAARMEADEAGQLTDLEEEDCEGEECEEEDGGDDDTVPTVSLTTSDAEAVSPTFSCGSNGSSARSHFNAMLSLPTASDASRVLDDALFCMDEDGGTRTPGLAASPETRSALGGRRASSCAAAVAGGTAPVTPVSAGIPSGTGFVSPPTASAESLSVSFDSMGLAGGSSLRGVPMPGARTAALGSPGGLRPMSIASADSSAFGGPASYVPGMTNGRPGTSQRPKLRRRRPVAGNRLRKRLPAEVYPPLVENRSPPAARIFTDMDAELWGVFMESVREQVAARLRSGVWKQAAPPSQVGLSCPKF